MSFRRCLLVVAAVALACSLASTDTLARERNWAFRFNLGFLDSSAKVETDVGSEPLASVEIGSGAGVGISFERLINRWVGIEFGFLVSGFDLKVQVSGTNAQTI